MKMRRWAVALVAAWLAGPAAAAFDLDQLMAGLARHPGGRANFTEKKYLAVLDKPVVATGEMRFRPPDYLEKRTVKPHPETVKLDKDVLTLERDQRKLSIRLETQPEALAFVDSIRALLVGDRATLEKSYLLDLSGTPQKWVLNLLPSDPRIVSLLLRITVAGSGNQVLSIEYLQADGDRSVLSIEPVAGS